MNTVSIKPLLESKEFSKSRFNLPIAFGVLTNGSPVYLDLSKMPHLLIGGRTGSGKSVFINSIISSLVHRFKSDQVKITIIDPKGIDFEKWAKSPYLSQPIVTDPTKAIKVLENIIPEMEKKYEQLNKSGSAVIQQYNEKSRDKMQYHIVIVDELADLMSIGGKRVEIAIQNIVQKARAVGIHLVIATQRPDSDVITESVRSNFVTAMSFQARSINDSMAIIDEPGAEQLLPYGDMLFSEVGRKTIRIHTPYHE
jgi:S-DNA-T family DNA segregation ATPase FtsK/SpoIIIE